MGKASYAKFAARLNAESLDKGQNWGFVNNLNDL